MPGYGSHVQAEPGRFVIYAAGVLLNDKTAIVTGAGSGIGAASARRFAAEGAAVVVADVRARKATEVAAQINESGGHAIAFEVDVADAASVEALVAAAVEQFGRLDVLFNNAGTLRPGSAVELSVDDWDFVMAVNVRSVFLGAKFAVPVMAAQGGGSIVNTASISGLHGDGGSVVYAASKAAVINLTRALSTDHAPQGIRVNAICPGTIRTPPVERMMADPAALDRNLAAHALGRLGFPEEIAAAALWLASDESSFVTGEAIVVDGGLRAQSPLGRLADPRPAHLRG
ncbi:MAG: SDR family oxidoreductase [Acidimicrobiia bacterium]|nr:SDR family oxidoreductase [Acidimicrobiia bacterium]